MTTMSVPLFSGMITMPGFMASRPTDVDDGAAGGEPFGSFPYTSEH